MYPEASIQTRINTLRNAHAVRSAHTINMFAEDIQAGLIAYGKGNTWRNSAIISLNAQKGFIARLFRVFRR